MFIKHVVVAAAVAGPDLYFILFLEIVCLQIYTDRQDLGNGHRRSRTQEDADSRDR
jgi:hypothetical protein